MNVLILAPFLIALETNVRIRFFQVDFRPKQIWKIPKEREQTSVVKDKFSINLSSSKGYQAVLDGGKQQTTSGKPKSNIRHKQEQLATRQKGNNHILGANISQIAQSNLSPTICGPRATKSSSAKSRRKDEDSSLISVESFEGDWYNTNKAMFDVKKRQATSGKSKSKSNNPHGQELSATRQKGNSHILDTNNSEIDQSILAPAIQGPRITKSFSTNSQINNEGSPLTSIETFERDWNTAPPSKSPSIDTSLISSEKGGKVHNVPPWKPPGNGTSIFSLSNDKEPANVSLSISREPAISAPALNKFKTLHTMRRETPLSGAMNPTSRPAEKMNPCLLDGKFTLAGSQEAAQNITKSQPPPTLKSPRTPPYCRKVFSSAKRRRIPSMEFSPFRLPLKKIESTVANLIEVHQSIKRRSAVRPYGYRSTYGNANALQSRRLPRGLRKEKVIRKPEHKISRSSCASPKHAVALDKQPPDSNTHCMQFARPVDKVEGQRPQLMPMGQSLPTPLADKLAIRSDATFNGGCTDIFATSVPNSVSGQFGRTQPQDPDNQHSASGVLFSCPYLPYPKMINNTIGEDYFQNWTPEYRTDSDNSPIRSCLMKKERHFSDRSIKHQEDRHSEIILHDSDDGKSMSSTSTIGLPTDHGETLPAVQSDENVALSSQDGKFWDTQVGKSVVSTTLESFPGSPRSGGPENSLLASGDNEDAVIGPDELVFGIQNNISQTPESNTHVMAINTSPPMAKLPSSLIPISGNVDKQNSGSCSDTPKRSQNVAEGVNGPVHKWLDNLDYTGTREKMLQRLRAEVNTWEVQISRDWIQKIIWCEHPTFDNARYEKHQSLMEKYCVIGTEMETREYHLFHGCDEYLPFNIIKLYTRQNAHVYGRGKNQLPRGYTPITAAEVLEKCRKNRKSVYHDGQSISSFGGPYE